MSEEGIDYGYCVTCPKCGKIQQRGYESDSVIKCRDCHHEFYVFMEGGFQMEFPASWVENEDLVNRMKAFVVSIGGGHGRIRYKPVSGMDNRIDSLENTERSLVQKIQRITNRGNNAEVKSDGKGGLKVYEVKKNIAN